MRARDACWADRRAAIILMGRACDASSRLRLPGRRRPNSSVNDLAAMDRRPAAIIVAVVDSKDVAILAGVAALGAVAILVAEEILADAAISGTAVAVADLVAGATGARLFSL